MSKNVYEMKWAGFLEDRNCENIKECFGEQKFDDKKKLFIDNLGYTEKELLLKKVFPTGIISGEILVNGDLFTGIVELIRPDGDIDSVFTFLGTIPVINGKIKNTPIMVGEYILGVRLDNYINNKKITEKNIENNVVISQSNFEKLYKVTAKNLPEIFIVNDDNLRIDLGKIEIIINERD
jgi:hypothetical protein